MTTRNELFKKLQKIDATFQDLKDEEQNQAHINIDRLLIAAIKFLDDSYASHVAVNISAKEAFDMRDTVSKKVSIAKKNEIGYTQQQVDDANFVMMSDFSKNDLFNLVFSDALMYINCIARAEMPF